MTEEILNVCFHGIGTPRRQLEPGEAPYWVRTDRFHEILDELATWPSVRISFDDGNTSDIDIGLPALLERDLRADFFVLAGRLGASGSLAPDQVRALAEHGMTIGSHGKGHRSWRGMDGATRDAELVQARRRLAEAAGAPVDAAACPLGRYDRRLLADLRRLGYRRVYTSDRRPARVGDWLQPRYSVVATDTADSLRAQVRPTLVARARLEAVGLAKRLR